MQIVSVQTQISSWDKARTFVVDYAGHGIRGTMRLRESQFPEPLKLGSYGKWYAAGRKVDRVLSAYPHSIDSEDAARAAATVALKGVRLGGLDLPRCDTTGRILRGNAERLVRPLAEQPCVRSLTGWHALRSRKLSCYERGCDGLNYRYPLKKSQRGRAFQRCDGFHYGAICACGFREQES